MGLITDLFFAIGHLFKWSFENLLLPIGYYADWIFTFIAAGFLVWWLSKSLSMGSDNEKDYKGW